MTYGLYLDAFQGKLDEFQENITGDIAAVAQETRLALRVGNINTVATPFTQKDTIRVVMLPGGNGEVSGLLKSGARKFSSLNFASVTFTKTAK